jgi:hypothetical protein
MTELTFLVELLLNHKLPKATRDLVAARIKEVEAALPRQMTPIHYPQPVTAQPYVTSGLSPVPQAASTLAAMARHAQNEPAGPIILAPAVPPVSPVAVIAQTPAAAAAINARNEAINSAISGKPEKGRTSPRKF